MTSSRSFDLSIVTKTGPEYTFTSINKEEHEALETYLKEKKIRVKSQMNDADLAMAALEDDDDDDDVKSVSESTFVEEIDSRRANGLFEWIVEMNKGGSIELRTCWTVSAPHDFEWSLSD